MKLLAIDTSTDLASIALLSGKELTYKEQSSVKTHAQTLLPLVNQLLQESDLALNQLDAIVFGCGPGSFTGLRIACSVAKGLAYAHNLGLIPISSLDAIAFKARLYTTAPILAVLDARMQELYWGEYAPDTVLAEPKLSAASNITLSTNQKTLIAGLGIDAYWENFSQPLQSQLVEQKLIYPHAQSMIELAQLAAIAPISAADASPLYVRNQVVQGEKRG